MSGFKRFRPTPKPSWSLACDGLPRRQRGRQNPKADVEYREQRNAFSEFCLRHSTLLRERELEFIIGLAHWRGNLTEKQFAWLSAIHERLRRRAA